MRRDVRGYGGSEKGERSPKSGRKVMRNVYLLKINKQKNTQYNTPEAVIILDFELFPPDVA